MDGLLLFNKPILWTSHDAVDFVRHKVGQKAVGHAGTLDPLATGLLIILLGKWTKRSEEFLTMGKSYEGTMLLGIETDSHDMDGKILAQKDVKGVDSEKISSVFSALTGKILQTPPIFSALKQNGKKLYEMARQGAVVTPTPREVEVKEFHLNYFHENEAAFSLSCSKGTYVRSLAHELGKRLSCGAVLSSLVRTSIGAFHLKNALTQAELKTMTQNQIEKYLHENLLRV